MQRNCLKWCDKYCKDIDEGKKEKRDRMGRKREKLEIFLYPSLIASYI
jgi:hypothetical protein